MNTPIYIAAYNQSKFGKLMDMKVPDILANAVNAVCRQIDVPPSVIDVGSVAGACSISLNEQGLLAGKSVRFSSLVCRDHARLHEGLGRHGSRSGTGSRGGVRQRQVQPLRADEQSTNHSRTGAQD